jgi:hypothetical protein
MERMEPHEFFDEEMDRDEHPVVTPSTGSASGNDAKAAPRFVKQHHRKPRRKVNLFSLYLILSVAYVTCT